MTAPIFPCRRVSFGSPCDDPRSLVMSWIEKRDSENWALISGYSLASDIHGWVAHDVLMRNRARDSMKSNSLDGEFMRLLSGTHHISTSFKRAGLLQGDKEAWIIDLSGQASDESYAKHAERMGFEILEDRPGLDVFDSERLGIEGEKSENGAIGHIHLADLR